jgi:site-specific recombinase XerD
MRNNISLLFWLFKAKTNKEGNAPLMIRISWRGERVQCSTGKMVEIKRWDAKRCKVKGADNLAAHINEFVISTTSTITGTFNEMLQQGDVCLISIMDKLFNRVSDNHTLMELIKFHNEQVKAKIGADYTKATYKKYIVTQDKVQRFLKHQNGKDDLKLKDLSRKLIAEFDFYLKTQEHNQQNTTSKHCKNLKRVINIGILHGWLEKSPFDAFKTPYTVKEKTFLTKDELLILEQKQFKIERLNLVKDLFIFQCYTGLAFADMAKLKGSDVITGIDSNKWIVIYRTKTKIRSAIPLLPSAIQVVNKYNPLFMERVNERLLPVYSNQKFNSYLHEITELCGFHKTISSHAGRRTFATTIGLANGVSLETISKILGHTTIKITQQYAIVTDLRVSEEMKKVVIE